MFIYDVQNFPFNVNIYLENHQQQQIYLDSNGARVKLHRGLFRFNLLVSFYKGIKTYCLMSTFYTLYDDFTRTR